MDENILKYLEDVRLACEDVESFFVNYPNRFDVFANDRLMIRAVERSVEIMGEAINRILKKILISICQTQEQSYKPATE